MSNRLTVALAHGLAHLFLDGILFAAHVKQSDARRRLHAASLGRELSVPTLSCSWRGRPSRVTRWYRIRTQPIRQHAIPFEAVDIVTLIQVSLDQLRLGRRQHLNVLRLHLLHTLPDAELLLDDLVVALHISQVLSHGRGLVFKHLHRDLTLLDLILQVDFDSVVVLSIFEKHLTLVLESQDGLLEAKLLILHHIYLGIEVGCLAGSSLERETPLMAITVDAFHLAVQSQVSV